MYILKPGYTDIVANLSLQESRILKDVLRTFKNEKEISLINPNLSNTRWVYSEIRTIKTERGDKKARIIYVLNSEYFEWRE